MGLFLDMRANQQGDIAIGRHPNENYAREILQLFSVGLYRMWDDGKFKLDGNANPIPTYTQEEILGFSAALTGWNYGQPLPAGGRLPATFNAPQNYLDPMTIVPLFHERASKLLLDGVMLPASTGQTPRVVVGSINTGTPCAVNTTSPHGLRVGDTVTIAGVTGGTFSAPITAAHQVTAIVDGDTFRVGVDCSNTAGIAYTNAAVTSATVKPFTYVVGGIPAVTGSQSDNAGTTAPHPYDQYGLNELDRAIDNIVENDNGATYICRQLIQRLVTSSPSPGYLYRVVQKFRDNGSGVRGNMAAVVRQILLDGDARNSAAGQASPTFGKQREPLLPSPAPRAHFPRRHSPPPTPSSPAWTPTSCASSLPRHTTSVPAL